MEILPVSTLPVFLSAALVLLLTPGPAVLYIVARSISQGRRAGLVSVLGIAAGSLFHIAAAAFGLSAILLTSALAFNIVKYLGAAYLIYLGIRTLRTPLPVDANITPETQPLKRIFSQGVIVNVLNPKTALFFFAFLPQFVEPQSSVAVPLQILFLGVIFTVLALFTDGSYALLAGTARHWLQRSRRFLQAQRYVAGTVYIGLGVATAISGGHKD